ncbi:KLUH, cytochrome P450, family 78, subfamily A, polypeptide 5 [Hibiscus trionum]|uniref:KLUH, cytochrome P450, family 78, subfamily A, polypeptide 5 n=1 Tax=Hibiscus trionum TaxID=183268 RepID=A0A9W7IXZ2_HIBTR|nr:KLUH, cytochrome P450, family 78, subfamily A, polypeptide 5 [Hibiscus trionum]
MSFEQGLMLFRSPLSSFEAFLWSVLLVGAVALWLSPGGLAWARYRSRSSVSIPGPLGFPFLGLLPVFTGATPHRVLAELAKAINAVKLMAFSVGFTRFIVSSDPETARDILNNSAFADRPVKESAYELLFHRAMGFAPYGEYWRSLRRISATHLFSPKRIAAFEGSRREIGAKMVEEINCSMKSKGEVFVRKVLHFGSLNNVMNTVFGKSYDFEKTNEGFELEQFVREGYKLLGMFNWSDHFPLLGWLDLQGTRKRCRILVSKVNVFVGKIIQEHRLKRVNGNDDKVGDFVDVLLDLENHEKLSDSDMIAVLWEMIFRGTDTVAILLEWILARMVLHPEIQAKAQAEIDFVVGNSRPVSDSDIRNLPYVQAIVKETLRVHPPGPLLSWARLAIHDVYIGDNFIPAGTTAMVNMWAIAHNEKLWPDPEKFEPERFMEEEQDVSIMGSDLRLAPFGSGRRVCPGKAMGLATVHLWLAQLLQAFKWVPCEDKDVQLVEHLKLSMEMKNPLVCKAMARFA